MRLLIAVKSCQSHRAAGYHDIILNTWGKHVPEDVDLRFFVGIRDGRYEPKTDKTVCLGVADKYMDLPVKTKAILGWSLWNQYDYVFLCDVDSFIIPALLLRCGFEKYDYSGRFGMTPPDGSTFKYKDHYQTFDTCYAWASGGVGYFLSRKAAELVARSWPETWAEDLYVGQVLGPHIRDGNITASDLPIECSSAWHFPRRDYNNQSYDPKYGWMEEMYARYNKA